MTAPTVRRQFVVVERRDAREWLVMLDDGQVVLAGGPKQALGIIKKAAKRGNKGGVTLTTVDWRGTPAGWKPPAL